SPEYDLIVIGGGSGRLACSKEVACVTDRIISFSDLYLLLLSARLSMAKKVAVLDYVISHHHN
ncbi:thioredoxin reductase, partial [Desmophyllum pertusum]